MVLRRIAPISLLLVMRVGAASAEPPVRETVARWHMGQRAEFSLTQGDKVIGRLGAVHAEGFTLDPDKRGGAQRELRFDEVRSAHKKFTTGQKWAIAGLVYAGLLGMGLVLGK